jgi:L-2-hydroxyglutarate oxidase LhgO
VATEESQIATLRNLEARAEANGVGDLRRLSAAQARALEPELACVAALLSPSTGIFDSHGFMLALQGDAEACGAVFAFNTEVVRVKIGDGSFAVETGGAEPLVLHARILINAAGLDAPGFARRIEGFPEGRAPIGYLCKGSYFTLGGLKAPFSRLIYPAPEQAGLGIHATLDLAGQCRFGPDVEWVQAIDYRVDPARAAHFYAAIRCYWPGLPDGALCPGYAGIRPKLQRPDEPPRDFLVEGPAEHGVPGLVNLFGIESPGLTAALALARLVAHKIA